MTVGLRSLPIGQSRSLSRASDRLCKCAVAEYGHGGMKYGEGGEHGGPSTVSASRPCVRVLFLFFFKGGQ